MSKTSLITDGLENLGPVRTGGQGSLYKGCRMGEILSAVKILPNPIAAENPGDSGFRDFQNEVLKLKKVNEKPNPHIVKILNYGLTDSGGFPFIEMEYIDGPDLEELIKPPHEPVFTVKEVIKLADQLANALAHCHEAGIKHGDIKSNNVKLSRASNNYILLDFGLAVMSDEERRTSLRYAGAIEFMAPEQSEGIMLFESDVYSFGIILYELLAGRVPFPLLGSGETARNTVMISHLETPVPDVLTLRRCNLPESWSDEEKEKEMQIPFWLLNVVSKCLEKEPGNRYRDGIELYESIVMNRTMNDPENPEVTASMLQQENERLHTLIMNHKHALNDRDIELASLREMISEVDSEISSIGNDSVTFIPNRGVSLPRRTFVGFLVLIMSFSAFTGYSVFSDHSINKDVVKIAKVPQDDTTAIVNEPDPAFQKTGLTEKSQISSSASEASNHEEAVAKKAPEQAFSSISPIGDDKRSRKQERKERRREKDKKGKGKFIEVRFY